MKTALRLTFRKGDLLAILLVLAMAAGIFAAFASASAPDENRTVQIYQDGRLVRELPLDEDASMTVDGQYRCLISIENGHVSVSDSDCPGRDCVHSGRIHQPGRSIVCLPNRVEIRISGASDVDFTVR